MPDFITMSLPVLSAVFFGGAALVWYAGTKLALYADEIAERSGLGQAVVGVLLLGAVTSLPEISTTTVATLSGNPSMAVNNLLGGVAFQVVVIALADLFMGKKALTSTVPGPRTILNALVSIVLLIIAAIGVMVGDWSLPGSIGFFPVLITVTYIICIRQLSREVAVSGWVPAMEAEVETSEIKKVSASNARIALLTSGMGLLILIGGTMVTLSAEGIAENTGVDTGLIGLTLLAFATSLPELSTAIAAVRLRRAELAIGDILGGNMFDIVLIGFIDVLDQGEPVLRQVDRASMTAALIGVLLTALVLIGLIERRDKHALRMGYDSIAVLIVYVAGVVSILAGIYAR
ncbi:sodium:calcium antiporter [Qipengyuania sp. SS22]|uniref:sodium:calcium antiporter n=1 Tax=Qipengyuania sp. SS22 TaxID=2979461 RepID=UPI0021E61107|nr:sodium:calcium antiporter [Qipengyuania sp. SS22]UYH54113.1 sodium:calcium antiporter [Qipengyuania sp. SS22]